MFVKWNCGCVGIRIDDLTCIVIDTCDDDIDALTFENREDNRTRSFEQLSDDKVADLITDVKEQLLGGYKWRAFLTLMDK